MSNFLDVSGTYTKVEEFGEHVVTNIIKNGATYAGPTITKQQWAAIKKAQSLVKRWVEADKKATEYYKQTRYWLVNGTGAAKQIDQGVARLTAWEIKRGNIREDLHDLGFHEF